MSRADLVRLMGGVGWDAAARSASLCGFDPPMLREQAPTPRPTPPIDEPAEPTPFTPTVFSRAPLSLPLLRFEEMTFSEPPPPAPPPSDVPLTAADLAGHCGSLFATPEPLPLCPWPRLWPLLRSKLESVQASRDPDVGHLVRALCRGEIVRRVPLASRRAWAGRASVWVDRSLRLAPFWSDEDQVWSRLGRVFGRDALRVRWLDRQAQARSIAARGDLLGEWGDSGDSSSGRSRRRFVADPTVPVLVLGDLGFYGSAVEQAAWLRTAGALRRAGVRVSALVPCPPARWEPRVARSWSASPWERGRLGAARLLAEPGCGEPATEAETNTAMGSTATEAERAGDSLVADPMAAWNDRALALLRLASPAAFVQPGLLRALRRLLPARSTDAATEVDAARHRMVRAAGPSGLVLHEEAAVRLRAELAAAPDVDDRCRRAIARHIGQWHRGLPRELLHIETLLWHGLFGAEVPPPGDLPEALAFAHRLTASSRDAEGPRGVEARSLARRLLHTLPEAVYRQAEVGPVLQRLFAVTYRGDTEVVIPDGIDARALAEDGGPPAPAEQQWAVRQVGGELVFSPAPESGAWASHERGPGSPVAWLVAARRQVIVRAGTGTGRSRHPLEEGLRVALIPGEPLVLETDRCRVTLAPWRPEPWAKAAGRDRFGLWADAEIAGVVQRFRWIPPGRFRMGSPESEQGRDSDEGPRHTVTWTRGRWVAETPVTQALWQAVMKENPSHFQGADRPVEQVSWDDCRRFVGRANQLTHGDFRLPSEAEWEYACRAGTSTSTWIGDLKIEEDGMKEIAWYFANSERQTQPVKQKAANPSGLHDMLGNVWEWCADRQRGYSADDLVDPPASDDDTGSDRVIRGGSWSNATRVVRAAFRFWDHPGDRFRDLGFRLSRGQAPSPAEPAAPKRPPRGSH